MPHLNAYASLTCAASGHKRDPGYKRQRMRRSRLSTPCALSAVSRFPRRGPCGFEDIVKGAIPGIQSNMGYLRHIVHGIFYQNLTSAKALNPLCPPSTLLSHTGTKAIACKIRRHFISVETEVLLANLITLSQTKHKLCPSRVDALAWPPF